ncbi:hypothetical protein J2S42_000587 [Catenuloplanes indicus]|uniref:Uncharacterized protein n=1 Tax=Catenuloplanes indicus TaxID=137267 RepID=A0AAE4AXB6_9ACTN|nr:hypothetical protein [Catenuloplanes indicus]
MYRPNLTIELGPAAAGIAARGETGWRARPTVP